MKRAIFVILIVVGMVICETEKPLPIMDCIEKLEKFSPVVPGLYRIYQTNNHNLVHRAVKESRTEITRTTDSCRPLKTEWILNDTIAKLSKSQKECYVAIMRFSFSSLTLLECLNERNFTCYFRMIDYFAKKEAAIIEDICPGKPL